MKTIKFLSIQCMVSITMLSASFSNDAYEKAMMKNVESLQKAQSIEDFTDVANAFERIATLQNEVWLPSYYAAYSNIMISNLQLKSNDKDAFLDKAQAQLEKAEKTNKDNSEIVALQGFILMMKVAIDPATRGQTLAGKVSATFEKAVALDGTNPRAQLLLGNWAYGSAQFFKTDTSEACGLIKNSLDLFEKEQPDALYPQWGKNMAIEMVKNCN